MNINLETITTNRFCDYFSAIQHRTYAIAKSKGWWDIPREDGTLLMLAVSELAEGLEYLRHGNPPSDHIPEFSGIEEELADCVIRLMDYAERHQLRLAEAIVAKMAFNEGREYKHGGKVF